MASKKVSIKLRRDTINNYASHYTHIPLKGEMCIVDPTATSPWAREKRIRVKIGDGVSTFGELPYLDQQNSNIFIGYYFDGDFYYDSARTTKLVEEDDEGTKFYDFSKMIFIDLYQGNLYLYKDEQFKAITSQVPNASEEQPGIMKLYSKLGDHTDGTMTQKAITDTVDKIRFTADGERLCLVNPNDEQED